MVSACTRTCDRLKMCPSQLAYLVLSPIPISLLHAMVTMRDSKDEPYYIQEELDT